MLRELDQRRAAGLVVTLEWDPDTDALQVRCEDEHLDAHPICYPVEPYDARLAFLHPFAYGARGHGRSKPRRSPCIDPSRDDRVEWTADLRQQPVFVESAPATGAVVVTAVICGLWLVSLLLAVVLVPW